MKKLVTLLLICITTHPLMGMESVLKKTAITGDDIKTCLKACRVGDVAAVQNMQAKGVKLDKPLNPPFVEYGYEGSTFLHWSVCHPEMIAFLLKHTPAHALDDERHTPLSEAICYLQPRTVALLLEHGANPAFTDLSLNSSLHEATRSAGQGFCGVNVSSEEKITRACSIIRMLKAKGAPLFLQNSTLNTPLHYAATSNNPDIVVSVLMPTQLLVQLKKDTQARLLTLLCMNKRNSLTQGRLLSLPRDIVLKIISHMPIECKHTQVEQVIVPNYKDQKTLNADYAQEIITLIKAHSSKADLALLHQTLITPNSRHLVPGQLTIDLNVQELLNPETWQ